MTEPSRRVLGRRGVGDDDQLRFAELIGDYNEIHMDPVAARRAIGGERVVHGVNTLLWAIDVFSAHEESGIAGVKATFRKPVHLREETELVAVDHAPGGSHLWVTRDGARLVDIRLELGELGETTSADDRTDVVLPRESAELTIEDLTELGGTLQIPAGDELAVVTYPRAGSRLGRVIVSQVASISRLIGMVCPGRYSMLSALDLTFKPDGSASHIEWKVTRADPRVGAVTIELWGGRVEGTVNAFVRPRPTDQPTMAQAGEVIEPDEFLKCRALVIGGSRGLGELTAKLLAAGGADVVLTWHVSGAEAERVVDEIRSGGGAASSIQLDAAEPAAPIKELSKSGWVPDQLYYYASPPIFARRTALYDHELFDRFARCYVDGFARAVTACRDAGASHLTALYPSTVAVEESVEGLMEYAAAKAAGEVVAHLLGAHQRWLTTVVTRLPRLPSDQTASLIPFPAEDPLVVLPEVVRLMALETQYGANTLRD